MPEGTRCRTVFSPSMTSVCPALCPPWKRTTAATRSVSRSTILPLPSSPHWAPITTTLLLMASLSKEVQDCNADGHAQQAADAQVSILGLREHRAEAADARRDRERHDTLDAEYESERGGRVVPSRPLGVTPDRGVRAVRTGASPTASDARRV